MGWQDRLDHLKNRGIQAGSDALEEHWPAIREALGKAAPALGASALTTVNDDETVTRLANVAHKLLPFPVRLVIRPARFAAWCLSNRDRILAALGPGAGAQN